MSNLKKFLPVLLILLSTDSISQPMYEFDCGVSYSEETNDSIGNPFGGRVKPNRTDLSGGQSAPAESYFPVLVVFIQFKNEGNDPRNTWLSNTAPTYLNRMIATRKDTIGEWWNWYDPQTEILSSHWAEISRGKFHVVSPVEDPNDTGAFAVNLSKTGQEYFEFYNYNILRTDSAIHREIWDSIKAHGLRDWRPYDRWRKIGNLFYFTELGQGDSLVDMIYQVFKTKGGAYIHYPTGPSFKLFRDKDGYNRLGTNYFSEDKVDTLGSRINYSDSEKGSGVTISFRGQLAQYLGTMGHEHGHQTYSGGHSTYSRVSYGFGFDNFSPADMILNEYMTPTNANINSVNYLGDYSSRNSGNGNLLKVPIQGNEYFLLASRNKYSKWDRVMTGDVAQIDAHEDNSEYGKGIYIYHVPNGISFPQGNDISQQDMECADGLFEWEYAGQSAQQVIYDCFISGATDWYYYKRKKVIYENDSSNLFKYCVPSSYTPRAIGDGISLRYYVGCNPNGESILHCKWWGVGDQPSNSCNIGTDRLFTNDEEIYTRFDIGGDREDPWKPGYNEVFSPYSSPNTNTWTTNPSNQNSGIFIWYYLYSGTGPTEVANIKIYKVGEGGLSSDSILHLTPPSRPMGLVVMPCDSQPSINGFIRIKLKWNHNMEPDMLPAFGTENKTYKVYRNYSSNMSIVPTDTIQYPENYYTQIATVTIDKDETPYFIDSAFISGCNSPPDAACPPICWTLFPVRYRVQAVDIYNDVSVLSDFTSTTAWNTASNEGGQDEGDNRLISTDENIPKEYALNQNYPNPFNPVTNIKYDLPFDNFVTIKIYDILGKEVMTLVNENKNAGRYIISFNGFNLASGIYYYKIKAGEFEQVRKMILIK